MVSMDADGIRHAIEQTQAEIDKRRATLREYAGGSWGDGVTASMVELLQDQLIFFESQLAELRNRLNHVIGH